MNRLLILLPLLLPAFAWSADKPAKQAKKPELDINAMAYAGQYHWGDWVEKDFPFFSSVLDCRDIGEGFPKDNLTPRGLILNLGHDLWACFDTDLLRISCIWQGKGVTPVALATGSYHLAGQKTKDGQDSLPKPNGKVWLANGIYPGWQVLKSPDDKPSFTDPREPGPSKEEVGRGALDEKVGRFVGVRVTKDGVRLDYYIGGVLIHDWFGTDEQGTVIGRLVEVAPCDQMLALALSNNDFDLEKTLQRVPKERAEEFRAQYKKANIGKLTDGLFRMAGMMDSLHYVTVEPHDKKVSFQMTLFPSGAVLLDLAKQEADDKPAAQCWPQTLTTKAKLSDKKGEAYVLDDIPLPLDNPWKRNIRLADIAFFKDKPGTAAAVTLDGDVWLISGLSGDLQEVKWKRFASGLHEPMSIVICPGSAGVPPAASEASNTQAGGLRSQEDIFVYDRNGIWKLRDTNNDGECDVYEMFCNRFAQTAETREFPNSMKLAPDGSFVISKGGQQGTTLGKDNGTVIRVAPDGKSYAVIGYGLRQPFVGVNPRTGLVTASDQEGNYTPTTPIQIIRDHHYYGFLTEQVPHEVYPETIADPLTWIPHTVVASAATQTWLMDAKMGTVNDEMILVSYNKPELFRVLMNERSKTPQAAVVAWIRNLDFPTLNAAVNPADGQLYAVGFQVWGTTVKRISGLARIRYTGEPRVLLKAAIAMDKGVLLDFNEPLDKAAAVDLANYSIERWNYIRTYKYGSPHLKLDGTPGQEWMNPSSAYLSKDGKSVFIGIPDMKSGVMQMRVGWGIKGANGGPAQNNVYFTPYELAKFSPEKEGFEKIEVDLTPRKVVASAAAKPTKEEGEKLYQMMGCIACHSVDGTLYGKVGPTWKGLFGSERLLAKGGDKCIADEAYIKESIQNPSAKIVKGFEKFDSGMPIYAGVLTDAQIEAIILYIKSLK
jgi:mono/diheme cytochrome c family protein